jgi:hypothetical protein
VCVLGGGGVGLHSLGLIYLGAAPIHLCLWLWGVPQCVPYTVCDVSGQEVCCTAMSLLDVTHQAHVVQGLTMTSGIQLPVPVHVHVTIYAGSWTLHVPRPT